MSCTKLTPNDNVGLMFSRFSLLIFLVPICYFVQSNLDTSRQNVYAYHYAKENEKAKSLLEKGFLPSQDVRSKIIGLVFVRLLLV